MRRKILHIFLRFSYVRRFTCDLRKIMKAFFFRQVDIYFQSHYSWDSLRTENIFVIFKKIYTSTNQKTTICPFANIQQKIKNIGNEPLLSFFQTQTKC